MTGAARRTALVVDDDAAHRDMLRAVVGDLGFDVATAVDGDEALARMAVAVPDVVLLDMRMPNRDGLATLRAMRERGLAPFTVVVTAFAELEQAVEAMKLGAADYLRKPIDIESLREALARLGGGDHADADLELDLPNDFVANSPLLRDACRDLQRVAKTDAAVLLRGETGTGKEVFARLLHRWSERCGGPLVAVNMAAMPEALVESELFGHARGAFTGAVAAAIGSLRAADGGTLFCDEIGELPIAMQPKLLRALEVRRFTPLGSTREESSDFRLVSATNRDLEAEIAAGRFRQDLYYRIAVVTIEIPPLRERPEDVLPLAKAFLAREGGKRLSPAAATALQRHDWPGNVRELQNAMLRASILAAGDVILPDNLPPGIAAGAKRNDGVAGDADSLAEVEERAILDMLERTEGNQSEAARRLGISRRKLVYRLKEWRGRADRGG
jgi:DNA-binding NtrC family response regulator